MRKPLAIFAVSAVAAATSLAALAAFDKPECIAGAKPGGGFDLTCKLAQQSLRDLKITAGADARSPTCPAASAPWR